MAFLGSIGRFFTSPTAAIIFPPAAITVAAVGALAHGQNPVGAVTQLYSPPPPRRDLAPYAQPGLNPDQRLQAVTQGPFIQTPFTSGSYIDELFQDEPISSRQRDVGYFGGASWPMERSSPLPVITPPGLAYSTPATTPGLVPEILSAGSLLLGAAEFFS